MKFIELLMPDPAFFYIVSKKGELAHIKSYNNINISFEEHVSIVNTEFIRTQRPVITYKVNFEPSDALAISHIFNQNSNGRIYCQKDAFVRIGVQKYLFKAQISAIPDVLKGYVYQASFSHPNENKEYISQNTEIKIIVKLDDLGKEHFFESVEKVYAYYYKANEEEISRFELMEI